MLYLQYTQRDLILARSFLFLHEPQQDDQRKSQTDPGRHGPTGPRSSDQVRRAEQVDCPGCGGGPV